MCSELAGGMKLRSSFYSFLPMFIIVHLETRVGLSVGNIWFLTQLDNGALEYCVER